MPEATVAAHEPALRALVERVQQARASRGTLRILGAGSKDFYGNPVRGEPLDMGGLSGISSYEPTELVVTARAGTKLAELEAVLAEQGQCLAFEPPRFGARSNASGNGNGNGKGIGGGTVGGMVAAGLSGPSRAAAGAVRDHVLGATLLNGKGEVLSFGGQVMKNVAGYDVSRLLAGSMGVLGAICEVSLKVLPRPAATATLRFEMDQAEALQQLNHWAGRPLPLHASAWWQGLLVLRLAGAAAAVEAAARALGGEHVPPELAAGFWDGLRDQGDEYFTEARAAAEQGMTLWRLSLPPTAPPLTLAGDCLVEWGGAQRWLSTNLPAAEVRDAAAAAGGHATLFRGRDRSAGVFAPLKSPLDRIHRELKRAFDPDGVFNLGRMYPGMCP
ncbi:MAG TPA: glycolate oxidase subunit GlcE [Rubrivivax sp.]|nr:glycolate oxidase subunit GlcE [Rubrivivax sp.]